MGRYLDVLSEFILNEGCLMSDKNTVMNSLDSEDVGEIAEFIKNNYANNKFSPLSSSGSFCAVSGVAWGGVAIYDVVQEKPFSLQWEGGRSNYLFMLCKQNGATFSSRGSSVECRANEIVPISISEESSLFNRGERGDRISVIISEKMLTGFVENWTGQHIVAPLSFNLQPLSQEAAVQWNAAINCLQQMMFMDPVPNIAADALIEHVLKMVLTRHANNYSEIFADDRYVNEGLARLALNLISSAPLIWRTLGMVARELACATDGLEKGIRRLTGRSALEVLYDSRLNGVNRALLRGDAGFVETIHIYGFSLSERFIFDYVRYFGESPGATYRRNSNSGDVVSHASMHKTSVLEKAISEYVDACLGGRIGLADIARHLNLTEQATFKVFRDVFSRTPMQYVIERRLERVRSLLCHTSMDISSIAIECGFSSQSYLTSTMKKYYGVTPRQMRIGYGGR